MALSTGALLNTGNGKIKIVRQISASAYFDAFEGSYALLNRPVFLKVARISDSPSAAAIVAAHVDHWRALALVQVPGMPVIFDIGQEGGRWFLSTEWVNSPSLLTLCSEMSALITHPTKFLILLLERCLTVLQTLHEQGFFHADISPGNIMVDPHPRPAFIYLVDPAPPLNLPDPTHRKRRLILGTANFLAPEVLAGDPASALADLFSLGMVVAEAARILRTTPPDLVQLLSASEPEHRPSSAEDALSILRASRNTLAVLSTAVADHPSDGVQAPNDGLFARIGKAFRRRRFRRAPDGSGETTVIFSVPQREQDVWVERSVLRSVPMVRGPPSDDWIVPSGRGDQHRPADQTAAVLEPAPPSVPMPQRSAQASAAHADFSVVAPSLIQAGHHFVVELWIAPSGEGAAMREQATRSGRMVERGGRSNINIDADTIITVILRLPDFEISDPVETLGWSGDIRNVGFIVKAPSSLTPGVYPGSAKLIQDGVPFASIMFDLEVVSADGQVDAPARPLGAHFQRIAHAFASYASPDRSEVLRRVQGIQAVGIDVFLDIVNLRSGEEWERVLYREIDASDSFFLFWSRNAAQSQWVEREWRYALGRRGIGFISPLPLEDPRLAEPPMELRSKHFNDIILAFIKLEELSNRL